VPNPLTIESPVTLIAPGRSGTSLLSSLFDVHPDFFFAGETVNLIFGSWHAAEFSSCGIAPLVEDGQPVPDIDRAARAVRQSFLTCVPDDKPSWFQKPLGVPVVHSLLFRDDEWHDIALWYWKVMRASFPKARYFTVLRNPCDVVLSSQAYWGYDQLTLWRSVGLLSYILAHPSSPVDYAIRFEDLTRSPREVVDDLFSYLEVPFHECVMEAFGKVHVPSAGREGITEAGTSRRANWDALDRRDAPERYVEPIVELFAKFGYEVELPEQFSAPAETTNTPAPLGGPSEQEVTIARLRATVSELTHTIEQLHVQHQDALRARRHEHRA
jgi:hypothetical protein